MTPFAVARKLLVGYRKKAVGLVIFVTCSLTIFLLGLNLLLNTFNGWSFQQMGFLFPQYFVSPQKDFDFQLGNFGFKELMPDRDLQSRAEVSLRNEGYTTFPGLYLTGLIYEKGHQEGAQNVIVVVVDFEKLPQAFATFRDQFRAEELASLVQEGPLIFSRKFAAKNGFALDRDYVLLTNDWNKNMNGLKMHALRSVNLNLSEKSTFADLPVVYVNLASLERLAAAPETKGWPLWAIATPHQDVVGPGPALRDAALGRALSPLGLVLRNPVDFSAAFQNTFGLYMRVFVGLALLIVVIVLVSVSSNLFILFHHRKSDFGFMKAYGYTNGEVGLVIFFENSLTFLLAAVVALAINLALSVWLPDFVLVNLPSSLRVNGISVAVLAILVAILAGLSLIRPLRYVTAINPIQIMREE